MKGLRKITYTLLMFRPFAPAKALLIVVPSLCRI